MSAAAAKVELICVGTELLEGRVNTHESYIGARLRQSGLELAQAATLPDDRARLAAAVAQALSRCDALIVCGGLGPTFDDLTREAVGDALGRGLRYEPALFADIKKKFARRRITRVPEENKRQAFVIEGARVLRNGRGSAPGQWLELPRRGRAPQTLALLPGPYAELAPIFERAVLPALRKTHAARAHAEHFVVHLSGISESHADEKLAFLTREPAPGSFYTILSSLGQVDFHATVVAGSRDAARRRLAAIRRAVRRALGGFEFGEAETTLEGALGQVLLDRGWTLAVAESCTGGGVGHRLTNTPGSSKYYLGGVVSYDNALKVSLLGVSRRTLAEHGAVSAACAREMAQGVRRAAGATLGLAITGVAGPGGGTPKKPVGLVYLALAGPAEKDSRVVELMLGDERAAIRQRAIFAALNLALRYSRRKTRASV